MLGQITGSNVHFVTDPGKCHVLPSDGSEVFFLFERGHVRAHPSEIRRQNARSRPSVEHAIVCRDARIPN